ncbi:MAG: cupin domain-containing protein [Prevotellaceae bacterium]|jgi:quercetin dioxygenase-like cupin family protein|nr:cupin domain-containing protein [Prevotellaceae bacterium]
MIVQSKSFFVSSEEKIYPAGEGISRRLVAYDENIMMVECSFEKGAIGALHTHPHVQTSYIASGKFEVQVENEKKILSKGDGFYVAPDVSHGCLCIEKGAIVDVFNPARRDFL